MLGYIDSKSSKIVLNFQIIFETCCNVTLLFDIARDNYYYNNE